MPPLHAGLVALVLRFRRSDADAAVEPTRDRLLSVVREHPGLPVGELARRLELRNGTLHYHLRRLEAMGVVRTTAKGRRRLVFPAGDAFEDARAAAMGLLNGDAALEVARTIAREPGASLVDVLRAVDGSPRAVYYHVKRLREAGLVLSASPTRYRDLTPSPLLLELLPRFEPRSPPPPLRQD